MRMKAVRAIFSKELREIFRDKKMLFAMFALPLIIYPLLIIGVSTVLIRVTENEETDTYTVAVSYADEALRDHLTAAPEDGTYSFALLDCAEYEEALASGDADCALTVDGSIYTVVFNDSVKRAATAAGYLAERLEGYKQTLSEDMLRAAGIDVQTYLEPITIEQKNLASNEQSIGSVFGSIVPLLLIIGVFLGTMTPAMDMTAGEKERGTQETLMTFPVSGHELICGKFLAVAVSGMLSAFLYMITVGILAWYVFGLVGSLAGEAMMLDLGAFIPAVAVLMVAVLAFALFLGAMIMCICSFAKSTKEASSYISPIMVVIMLIAYIGFLDVHLTPALAVVPVLNIVLLIKSVLVFEYDAAAILLVLISNLAYAAIAISILGRLYTSERILFGEHEGSLLERRSQRLAGAVPTVGDSVLTLLIALVLFLYAGSLLQLKYQLVGVGLTQLILLAVPLLAAWYGRTDVRETFSLRTPKLRQLPAVILLAVGGLLLCNGLCQPIAALAQDSAETYSQTMELLEGGMSFGSALLIIGLAPAVCEEALFRGYLFSSMRKKLKPGFAILLSALLFGIYHFNLFQSSYAFLLGLIIAYTVYRTGSILCGALIHFLCNSASVVLTFYEEPITEKLPFLAMDSTGALLAVIAVGAVLTALGILLLRRTAKKA